ncbi:hypothetical protein ACWGOQ_0007000 [Aquimarina sp. M1]
MKSSSILGIASILVKGKKYRLLLAGAQFAYLGFKYYQKKKRKHNISNTTPPGKEDLIS